MSFTITDEYGRSLEIDTNNTKTPTSVFITCGAFCIEISRGAFFDAMRAEVEANEFYRIIKGFRSDYKVAS